MKKPFIPTDATYNDKYAPAMAITDQAEADLYFEACVEHCMRHQETPDREAAEDAERSSLGYFAGYYDAETRARVERLFRCEHPVFGAIAVRGQPTVEEALEAGRRLGRGREGE